MKELICQALCEVTFITLLSLSEVYLGDGFEVHVPESNTAVPTAGGETLLTRMHTEDPSLRNSIQKPG